MDTVTNGPVVKSAKAGSARVTSEFQDLADARTVPAQPAATGQPLTQYHSLFYRLLSWKNPAATGISYAACVLLIFATRYISILPYVLKMLYWALGTAAVLEVAGKALLGNGLASQFRPRTYFVIPKHSLAMVLDDAAELTNFFVIEFQRVLFAESVGATVAAFFASFTAYWLIKFVPLWGLALIATSLVYLTPLIYTTNKELIDGHLLRGREIISKQADQVRSAAAQHTGQVSVAARSVLGEYGKKAQQMIGSRGGMDKPDKQGKSQKMSSEKAPKAFPEVPQTELGSTTGRETKMRDTEDLLS